MAAIKLSLIDRALCPTATRLCLSGTGDDPLPNHDRQLRPRARARGSTRAHVALPTLPTSALDEPAARPCCHHECSARAARLSRSRRDARSSPARSSSPRSARASCSASRGRPSGCRARRLATTGFGRSPAWSTSLRSPRRYGASANGPRIIISRRWHRCCGWSCPPRPRSTGRASSSNIDRLAVFPNA